MITGQLVMYATQELQKSRPVLGMIAVFDCTLVSEVYMHSALRPGVPILKLCVIVHASCRC